MNKKIRFFQSINFKIALVFALMLLITLEIVGAFFVRQLERQNLSTFKQQVQLQAYIDNSLSDEVVRNKTSAGNTRIRSILTEVNNPNITEIRVIDNKGTIRGTSNVNDQTVVGQKTTDSNIKNAIYNNRSYQRDIYDTRDNNRYYVSGYRY